MKIELLKHEIEAVSVAAMPAGDIRYYLCGISIETKKDSSWVSVIGTDSHRLHILQVDNRIRSKKHGDEKFIICINSVHAILKIMETVNASGVIIDSKKLTWTTVGGTSPATGGYIKVDGNFVDWRGVVKNQVAEERKIERVGVNVKYLLDAQSAIKAFPSFSFGEAGKTGLDMQFHGSDSPIVMTHSELDDNMGAVNFYAIVMPLLSKYLTSPKLTIETLQ